MFTMLRTLTARELLTAEGPGLMVAVVVAELFYRFHSFTLECVAFLATWFAISALARGLTEVFKASVRSKTLPLQAHTAHRTHQGPLP